MQSSQIKFTFWPVYVILQEKKKKKNITKIITNITEKFIQKM